jgi:hypothetical protein
MEQLTLSFHEELLLKLKPTDWEFVSRPDSFEGISPNSKFIQLDRSSAQTKSGKPEKSNPQIEKK